MISGKGFRCDKDGGGGGVQISDFISFFKNRMKMKKMRPNHFIFMCYLK